MSRHDDMEFMDIDGPEFIADVNNQIADIRASYSSALNQEPDIKASAILEHTNSYDEPQNGNYMSDLRIGDKMINPAVKCWEHFRRFAF